MKSWVVVVGIPGPPSMCMCGQSKLACMLYGAASYTMPHDDLTIIYLCTLWCQKVLNSEPSPPHRIGSIVTPWIMNDIFVYC
jgi:hypothetical protein